MLNKELLGNGQIFKRWKLEEFILIASLSMDHKKKH